MTKKYLPAIFFLLTPSAAIASDLSEVCEIYESSAHEFAEAKAEYEDAINSSDGNEFRKQKNIDNVKKDIDNLFSKRNDSLFKVLQIGQLHPIAVKIIADRVNSSFEDRGDGGRNYAEVEGHIPCSFPVRIVVTDIDSKDPIASTVADLNPGEAFTVRAAFMLHDYPNQRKADAIQWAGPVWGLFFNLRTEAFDSPVLKMSIKQNQ